MQNIRDVNMSFEEEGYEYPVSLASEMICFKMLSECPDSTMVIFEDIPDIHRNLNIQRAIRDLGEKGKRKVQYVPVIIISSSSCVPQMMQESTIVLDLPLYNRNEVRTIVSKWCGRYGIKQDNLDEISNAATGLTSSQMANVFCICKNRYGKLDAKTINDEKMQAVRKHDTLTYIDPEKTLDSIGGHKKLKEWIRETKLCMNQDAADFGIKPSRGAIFLGLAGTGKTAIGEAIANYFGMPFIIFNISRMMGGIVGQSENTVREAFEVIRSIGECVVLMDEIDKGVSGVGRDGNAGSQDGGTIARVFGVILENMQNNTGQFYILTANNVDKIPAPLTRSGRIDSKWFFDFPEKEDRESIFSIYFKKAKKDVPEDLLGYAADVSDHFTGAEIETAVNNILKAAFLSDKKISKKNILAGISRVNPIYETNKEEVDRLKEYAQKNNIPSTEEDNTRNTAQITEESFPELDYLEDAAVGDTRQGIQGRTGI